METPNPQHEPAPAPPARPAWTPRALWAAGCGAGCAVLVLLQGAAVWGITALMLRAPQELAGKVSTPPAVVQGRAFPLTLAIRNEGKRPTLLTSIVARQELTDRLTLARSTAAGKGNGAPPSSPDGPQEPITLMGTTTWPWRKTLRGGEQVKVTFQAAAKASGTLSGRFEIQSGFVPIPVPFKIEVRPASGGSSPKTSPPKRP